MTTTPSTFVLRIDPVKVDREFKMMERGHGFHTFNPMVTKLEDLGISDEKISDTIFTSHHGMNFVTYYPEYVNAKDYPPTTPLPCFYCTESFNSKPIGIPLRFIPSYYKMNMISRTEQQSSIPLDIIIHTKRDMKEAEKRGETIIYRDYFETEGNFCSFPCMLSFLSQHPKDTHQSLYPLIKQMYYAIHGNDVVFSNEMAPDIRMLKKFGGHLTISEFRSSEGRKYKRTPNFAFPVFSDTERPPLCVPSARLFQYYGTKL